MARDVTTLREELYRLIRRRYDARRKEPSTPAIASFLQVHAHDLKSILGSEACRMLRRAADEACNADVVLAFLSAGARPEADLDLYSILLQNHHIYDLNGDELDDAGVAARLRAMHEKHGVRIPPSEFFSDATSCCAEFDRLECLRFMLEVDPHARRYTRYDHDSLLHLAARRCSTRMVTYLLENGWILDSLDLNDSGQSPVGACLQHHIEDERSALHVCDTLDVLLQGVKDATPLVLTRGLCEFDDGELGLFCSLLPAVKRMIMYVCAAVHAHSILPRSMLSNSSDAYLTVLAPLTFPTLALDEHVGEVYLPDPLRLGGIALLPVEREGVQLIEAVPETALRFAVTVDALCVIQETPQRTEYSRDCFELLRTCMSLFTFVTCVSPTVRHWAWLRRLHAMHARRRELVRMGEWPRVRASALRRQPKRRGSGGRRK